MEILFVGFATLLVSLVTLFNPLALGGLQEYDIPLRMDAVRATFDQLALKIMPQYTTIAPVTSFPSYAEETLMSNYIPITGAGETFTTTVTATPTATPTAISFSGLSYDPELSFRQNVTKWLQSPIDLPSLTCIAVLSVSIFVAILQWKQHRMSKKGHTNHREAPEASLQEYLQSVIEQKNLALQKMDEATREQQQFITIQLETFKTKMDDLQTAAEKTAEDVKQAHGQFQEKLTALNPDEELDVRLEQIEENLAEVETAAGKALKDINRQVAELLEEKTEDLDFDGFRRNLISEFAGYLAELKRTTNEAMEDEVKHLKGQFEEQGAAMNLQADDLKSKKQALDASIRQIQKTADKGLENELKRVRDDLDKRIRKVNVQERADSQMSAFMVDLAKAKKGFEESVSVKVKELKDSFYEQVRAAFRNFFSKDAFERLVKEVVAEQVQSALSNLTSGDLASFIKQKLEEEVNERVKSSPPALVTTGSAASTTRPQGQVREAPKSLEGPSQGVTLEHQPRKDSSAPSTTTRPQDNVKGAPETGTPSASTNVKVEKKVPEAQKGPQEVVKEATPAPAPTPSTTATPSVGEAPKSKGPFQGTQSSQWASPAPGKGKKKGKAPASSDGPSLSLQGSKGAAPASSASSTTTPSSSKVEDVPKPKGHPQSSTSAPPTKSDPAVPPKQDKGKQPERKANTKPATSTGQGIVWSKATKFPPSGPSQVDGQVDGGVKEPAAEASSKGQTTGEAKQSGAPPAQSVGAQDTRGQRNVKSPSPAKPTPQTEAHSLAEAIQGLRPTPSAANVPPLAGTDIIPPPSVPEEQSASGKESEGATKSTGAPEPTPETPAPPPAPKRPPPRAGLVQENVGFKKAFASLGMQQKWPPAPRSPKGGQGSAPVKRDQAPPSPGAAVSKGDSKVLSPVEKGQTKEAPGAAAPKKDAAKSASWADMVEEGPASPQLSPGVGPSTGAADVRPAIEKGPVPKAPSGVVGQPKGAAQAGSDAPIPSPPADKKPAPVKDAPKAGDKKVSSGLSQSKWADEPAGSAGKGEKKVSKGMAASRWAS
ncbi:hypothetical protein P170DRAFT_512346 [Aspergillus steynii IBT 23096]|uniref:Uncharacterized protein n=1 Tax=Aspergillus steynii IBT 23096 TaxID=1392250 RepID=A0A2I2FYJ0_9EURO|nr:uncharacterized protein P170DRAFT_512346 [Aspergillus steynii IBT 23096]PLB45701.1 hypothetical protein P170DRAFT_512346 [Aspergillus steynii IBT 23096]